MCNNVTCNVSCENEIYNPSQRNLAQTWVVVSNLTVGESYKFRVYARNHLNNGVPKEQWRFVETNRTVIVSSKLEVIRIYDATFTL